MHIPNYHVVAAIIQYEEKILCVQKGPHKYGYISYKYEFPGGKVESGESLQVAMEREIREELHLNIRVGNRYDTVSHVYPDFHITLDAYLCLLSDPGTLRLTEHISHQWLTPAALTQLDWAEADLPIATKLAATANHP